MRDGPTDISETPAPVAVGGGPSADPGPAERRFAGSARRHAAPASSISPVRWTVRYWISRIIVWMLIRAIVRLSFEGRDRLPAGPAIYCFNHLGWVDPFMLMGTLPFRPRLMFFGPKEDDM